MYHVYIYINISCAVHIPYLLWSYHRFEVDHGDLYVHTIWILCGYAIWSGRHPELKSASAGATAGRPRLLVSRGMSAWLYRVTTKSSFYPVHTYKILKQKIVLLTVLWNEKSSVLMTIYLSIYLYDIACQASWRPLQSEARGSIPRGVQMVHKPARTRL